MINPNLLISSGLAISVIGHVVVLTVGLIFAGANPFDSVQAEAITVDIVSPDEAGPAPVLPVPPPETTPGFENLAGSGPPPPQGAAGATSEPAARFAAGRRPGAAATRRAGSAAARSGAAT